MSNGNINLAIGGFGNGVAFRSAAECLDIARQFNERIASFATASPRTHMGKEPHSQILIHIPTHELPNIVRSIIRQAASDDTDTELLKTMLPRKLPATRTGTGDVVETAPIVGRLKWRIRMADKFDVPLLIFKDDPIDESTKSDDLNLIKMHLKVSRKKPSRNEFAVAQKDAAFILTKLGRMTTARTIRNWEYGKGTPDGYTRNKRISLEAFTAWANVYVAREKSKLNSKMAIAYCDNKLY